VDVLAFQWSGRDSNVVVVVVVAVAVVPVMDAVEAVAVVYAFVVVAAADRETVAAGTHPNAGRTAFLVEDILVVTEKEYILVMVEKNDLEEEEEILDESLGLAYRTCHDTQLPPWGLLHTVAVVAAVVAAAVASSLHIAVAGAARV
jgi:hypothetical protein